LFLAPSLPKKTATVVKKKIETHLRFLAGNITGNLYAQKFEKKGNFISRNKLQRRCGFSSVIELFPVVLESSVYKPK
jgi:hypothetical protein